MLFLDLRQAQDMSPEELTSLLLRIQDDPDEYDKYMQVPDFSLFLPSLSFFRSGKRIPCLSTLLT